MDGAPCEGDGRCVLEDGGPGFCVHDECGVDADCSSGDVCGLVNCARTCSAPKAAGETCNDSTEFTCGFDVACAVGLVCEGAPAPDDSAASATCVADDP